MATNLYPTSSTSTFVLPPTGATADVATALPFGVYTSDGFKQGASDQVAFVYQKLGGNVLDIELKAENVYAAYEDAVLEYSYLVNLHQAKNSIQNALGSKTGSFDSDGELSGSSDSLQSAELKFPKYDFGYIRNVAMGFSEEAGVGGRHTVHSASIDLESGVQTYDLQESVQNNLDFSSSVGGRRIYIKKVFYKTGRAFWSLYGIYGGLNVVGNFLNYNSYASDSTFEMMPTWEMKQRVMNLEDRMWTRTGHFSYQLRNNKLKIYPAPANGIPSKMFFEFIIPDEGGPWVEASGSSTSTSTVNGVNNINTIPFSNIPYENVNAIGKHFIRNYALESCKESLGYIRGKYATIPIPNENVTLNGEALVNNAKEAKEKLKEELLKILEETDYANLSKREAEMNEDVQKTLSKVPFSFFVG